MILISIVGFHHKGKTTACENIINALKIKGKTVSSIKYIHQDNFTIEKIGSNTNRLLTATQNAVFGVAKNETFLIWNKKLALPEMLTHLESDYVIIEGGEDANIKRIIAAQNFDDIDNFINQNTIFITGEFAEKNKEYKGFPCLNSFNNINEIIELIIETNDY
jgi:molybdopterin-guanine dinucleotide biosynthesis protein B